MCGIAGVFNAKSSPDAIRSALAAMNAAQVHRGPDDGQVLMAPVCHAGLASRRLAIVDIEGGRQPVSNEDRTIHGALNGEIYNHVELREQLTARGHVFRSRCDTEIIVHAYEQWGDAFLDRLDGMFGLAVLDTANARLLLARDGPGMKPLFYAETPRGFLFSSEAKALFATGWIAPELDPHGLDSNLALSYTPAPLTMFRGVRQLGAGERLVADAGGVHCHTYWQFRYEETPTPRSDDAYVEELESLFRAAISTHLAADVPVGVFLSGGWDSSLATAFAAAEAGARLQCFSVVFPESPRMDESRYSRLVAREFGAEHHEIEFRHRELPAMLPALCRHLEQPLSSNPAGVGFHLASLASRHVKAVIGGEGADELFGGYLWMRVDWPYRLRPFIPRSIPRLMLRWDPSNRRPGGWGIFGAATGFEADLQWRRAFQPHEKRRLLKPEFRVDGPDMEPAMPSSAAIASCRDRVQRRLLADITSRLANGVLPANDRVAMAHSLELRLPFLDRSIVAFASRLPSRLKARRDQEKVIISHLAQRHLPPEIARRQKHGLSYPPELREDPGFKKFAKELLLDSPDGPFDRARLEAALPRWQQDETNDGRLWRAVFMQSWWNEFLGPGQGIPARRSRGLLQYPG